MSSLNLQYALTPWWASFSPAPAVTTRLSMSATSVQSATSPECSRPIPDPSSTWYVRLSDPSHGSSTY
eukprot:4103427-Pyramimonas_sp.AAC.1